MKQQVLYEGKPLIVNGKNVYYEAHALPTYPTDGLIARWDLNESLIDSVAGYTLVAMGDAAEYENGKVSGKALTVNASHKYEINNSTIGNVFANTEPHTVVVWFKGQGGNSIDVWNVGKTSMTNGEHLHVNYTAGTYSLARGGSASDKYAGSSHDTTTDWRQAIYTYASPDYEIYHNNVIGTFVAGTADGQITGSEGTGNNFFGFNTGNGADLIGAISHVYIYNKVLTADERAILYNNGTPI